MNRKTEDQLVRLAFGDLTPEEAARLQAEAEGHPDSARALDTYRRMKSELRSLADVPEDQLSKERLREAILARGLREHPAKRSFSWLWLPAAAAALAFGVTFMKGRAMHPTGPTVALMGNEVVKSPGDLGTSDPFKFKPHKPVEDSTYVEGTFEEDPNAGTSTDVAPGPRLASNMSRSRGGRSDSDLVDFLKSFNGPGVANASDPEKSSAPGASSGSVGGLDRNDTRETHSEPINTFAHPMAADASGTKPAIILIEPEKDNNTGARKATEVESASNVLVGG